MVRHPAVGPCRRRAANGQLVRGIWGPFILAAAPRLVSRRPLADLRWRHRATQRPPFLGSTGPRSDIGPEPGQARPRLRTDATGPSPDSTALPLAGRGARPAGV